MSKLEKFLTPEQVKLFCDNERDFVLNEQFKNILKQNMKDIVSHFKKDRWPLSLNYIRSTLLSNILGADDFVVIAKELANHKINVGYGLMDNESVIYVQSKTKKRKSKKTKTKRRTK